MIVSSSDLRFIGAQVRRSFMGSKWLGFAVASAAMCMLSASSLATQVLDEVDAGGSSAAIAFPHLMRLAFASLLFATLWGALLATSEFKDSSVGRTVLLARGRGRAAVLSALATIPGGALMGLLTTAGTTAAVAFAMSQRGMPLTWNKEVVLTVVGLIAVSALASPWGNFLGWLLRQQVVTLLVIVAWTFLIETMIVKAAPDVFRYLPGGAQSSIVLDVTNGNPLANPWGYVLFTGYLVLAGAFAVASNLKRDLV